MPFKIQFRSFFTHVSLGAPMMTQRKFWKYKISKDVLWSRGGFTKAFQAPIFSLEPWHKGACLCELDLRAVWWRPLPCSAPNQIKPVKLKLLDSRPVPCLSLSASAPTPTPTAPFSAAQHLICFKSSHRHAANTLKNLHALLCGATWGHSICGEKHGYVILCHRLWRIGLMNDPAPFSWLSVMACQ